ncbi:MAG TPA: phospholipase D-like domain-containing protein [Burkholderiaceae bacterium]|nr:phospholipase D-like domain-containing protein [Burkholderiaceae bacterium]
MASALAAAAVLLLAGCASPPATGPVPPEAPRVQLAGASAPLSERRSAAIVETLKDESSKPTSIFDRHLATEQAAAGTPLIAGNKVTLLQDGEATYAAMFKAIASARDHINLESYIFKDDEVGKRFAAALIAKQREGVQVNLIHDSIGAIGTTSGFFDSLRGQGIRVLEFNPINPLAAKTAWNPNQRDHRKLLIVDGRRAFLGGINVTSIYSGGSRERATPERAGQELPQQAAPAPAKEEMLPWRDTDLLIEGPVVAEFQRMFLDTWQRQRGEPLPPRKYFPPLQRAGNEVMRAIGSSPDAPYSPIYATLLSAINSAETDILLTNAYFAPDPQFLNALQRAAARGVAVKLLLPSRTDSWLVLQAGRSYYDELLEAGVKIYERRDALLHSKTTVIDGVWSSVGSANLDWRSFVHNQEVNAVVLGADFARQMHAAFERDLDASREITLAEWRRRPPSRRLAEMFARLWSYWL